MKRREEKRREEKPRPRYIASCSCGKDSLAMLCVIKAHPEKYPLDEIVICKIKATKTMSGCFPIQQAFIDRIIPILQNEFNVPVTVIEDEMSFEEIFYTEKKSGKRVGNIYGFPYTIGAWCNDRLKMRPMDKYFKKQGNHIRYIGIAYDEPNRYARLEDNEVAPLYEEKIIEAEAKEICINNNLLSPIYEFFDRDGCWFCPKQSLYSLRIIYDHFPNLWEQLKIWQKDSPTTFNSHSSILELDKKFKAGFQPKKIIRKKYVHNKK